MNLSGGCSSDNLSDLWTVMEWNNDSDVFEFVCNVRFELQLDQKLHLHRRDFLGIRKVRRSTEKENNDKEERRRKRRGRRRRRRRRRREEKEGEGRGRTFIW